MRILRIASGLIAVLLLFCVLAMADDIYPPGTNIICRYSTDRTEYTSGDTMLIIRSLVNNESFSLTGLYMSDNLPPEFTLISCNLRINGVDIDHHFTGISQGLVIGFYDTYYWVVDSPDDSLGAFNLIDPGDSLSLEILVMLPDSGLYLLPLRTTVFYGNQTGYFATDEPLSIAIDLTEICGDANGDFGVNLLDITFIISYLYKGGLPPVPIDRGDIDNSAHVNLLDATYLISYLYKGGAPPYCP
ncbi:MAG: hypothetical protein DRP46_05005 [Candidatus Zixiibacteriota bacterium]|nr:MAG: hypothetical protein DRP46_05005 [candidate division Zixibacteria bacterium]HDL03950.1 hypothetical protein [candidate division Zixibacteria bacterium]